MDDKEKAEKEALLKQKKEEREALLKKEKEEKKEVLLKLIAEHGSAYKAAKNTGVSLQAFYERMDRAGISRTVSHLLDGEPEDITQKRLWLEELLKGSTVKKVASQFGIHENSIRARMRKCGIDRTNHGIEPQGLNTKEQKAEWLRGLLAEYGSIPKISKALKVSEQALYERASRYGVNYSVSKTETI
jgi:DNA invertase Pin-like site-specific DNA recombinase